MQRRAVVKGMASVAALAVTNPASALGRTRPASAKAWDALRAWVGGRLIKVESPLAAVAKAGGAGADELFARIQNPYFLGDEAGLTQTLGWVDAWTSQPSDYAVVAESAADVAAAVDFAQTHGVKLVVKGGGHSYFGNSNAANSLLIWTRRMRQIELHDAFVPLGGPAGTAGVAAVTIGAGAIWGQVYDAVAVKGGRYVQGGGCLTVGVAGFVQGGGFGSLSKQFGTGASNLLEAEIVTADGQVLIANAHRHPELFFALRGGGGGSFGVITRLTLRTDPLPEAIGAVLFKVSAKSDAAWRALVAKIVEFYASALFNPQWGEQLRFADRELSVSMLFHSLSADQAKAVWKPFLDWIAGRPDAYALGGEPVILSVPGGQIWNPEILRSLPGVVLPDDRPGAPASNIFWASNRDEAAQVLHAYQSAWLPQRLLEPERQGALADALVAASAEWTVALHANKGLAGGSAEARERTAQTAMNAQVLDAFALIIVAAEGKPAWPGIPGHEPDVERGRRQAAAVTQAMAPIRRLVPDAGAYMSETDYFLKDWKRAHWGENYPRLARAKRRYDPTGLFSTHHGVEQA
jgi:FAD/FMN-containing dehydrogenase